MKKGFTLIELLIVIAIILLSTLALTTWNNAKEESSKDDYTEYRSCEDRFKDCRKECADQTWNDIDDCLLRCDIKKESC